jgi:glycosyltransferase involved in cell wall biosynthesis
VPERPRLLLLIEDVPSYQRHRRGLALAAAKAGFEVHVAAGDDDLEIAPAADAEGIRRHTYPYCRAIGNPLAELGTLRGLRQLLSRVRPDVVHVYSPKLDVYAGLVTRLVGVPAVIYSITGLGHAFTTPGAKGAVLRRILTSGLRFAFAPSHARVVFQNPNDQQELVAAGLVPQDKTVLIRGSGVDVRDFEPIPFPEDPPLVMLASRLIWDKGVGVFVEAARLLKKRGVAARFVLVGESDPENPESVSREQLEAWDREGVIEWWGSRDGKMPETLAQSHVICLPSHYREGIPKILLEGAAAGRPLVATDTRGCREICIDDESGLLVPVRDPQRLADALRTLIDDPSLRARLGARARELAVGEFSADVVCKKTIHLYRMLLSNLPTCTEVELSGEPNCLTNSSS